MESRIQRIFLSDAAKRKGISRAGGSRCVTVLLLALAWLLAPVTVLAESAVLLEDPPLAVRDPERRPVRVDRIDTENFEVGVFTGLLDVEDFGSQSLLGVRAAYHVTEDLFVEAAYARSKLGRTSFEELSGGAQLLTDGERDLSYWSVSAGWDILPGESFIGRRWAFKSSLYLLLGAGSTRFGGDDVFTLNAGLGYRFILLDWLALHVTAQDHMFESDLLGKSEDKHNFEVSGSLTVFF